VQANWYGTTGLADNCGFPNIQQGKDVAFRNRGPSDDLKAAAEYTRQQLQATALTITYASSEATADVILEDMYYTTTCEAQAGLQWINSSGGGELVGLATCLALVPGGQRCDQHLARISNYYFDSHGSFGDKFITCHEAGHTVGLAHRNAEVGCLFNASDQAQPVYTAHDRAHLAANWSTEPCDAGFPLC
jgi:hypothetical protein